jgi:hypoxanthine-guanine phosphoribosyltransferase
MGEGTSNDGYRIRQTLLTSQAIQDRISALGQQISQDYAGQELVLVGVLKGSLYFMADLSRAIDLPLTLDFMTHWHDTEHNQPDRNRPDHERSRY